MRGVDLAAQLQALHFVKDVAAATEQPPRGDAHQIAGAVANFTHDAHQQPRRRLAIGMFAPAAAATTTAVTRDPKHIENGLGIGPMFIGFDQQRLPRLARGGHRGEQLAGGLQRSRAQPQGDYKSRGRGQSHMNPRAAASPTRSAKVSGVARSHTTVARARIALRLTSRSTAPPPVAITSGTSPSSVVRSTSVSRSRKAASPSSWIHQANCCTASSI